MGACCSTIRDNVSDSESDSEYSESKDRGPMQQLEENVWLGNEEAGKDLATLKANGIKHICAVGWDLVEHHKDTGEINYHITNEIYDAPDQDIMPTLKASLEFIDEVIQKNEKVLIHCVLGISRSATIATAYIMKKHKKTFVEALKFVRSKRCVAVPSLGFEYQLYQFEKKNYSLDLEKYYPRDWKKQLEDYCRNVVLPKTKKLQKDADAGSYSGQDLYALTCNWLELIRLQIFWPELDALREEAVKIMRQVQVDHVQDEATLQQFDKIFYDFDTGEDAQVATEDAQAGTEI